MMYLIGLKKVILSCETVSNRYLCLIDLLKLFVMCTKIIHYIVNLLYKGHNL